MLFINQNDYPHIDYNHNLDNGGMPEGRRSIATSGCGLCSLCMVVDHLTVHSLSVEECKQLSYDNGANRQIGTNLKILAPIVAEKFGLSCTMTSDAEELKAHLRSGGEAIANVGGDRDGYTGLFAHVGHYIVVVSADGDELCILDPAYHTGRYEEEGRKGKVRVNELFAYCSSEALAKDAENRTPSYYLFKRK